MASRNKKGKIHGIFKSAFQISFFHKPTMEETDIYYYVIIEDIIFLKMRLLFDTVLVIDEVYPLTMTYIESYYEKLFSLLKGQTAVTVVVSLTGNTTAFRQTCIKFDAPVVEKEEFLDCSIQFYNKFKNYCRNDISKYGFYLIALKEDTFSIMEESKNQVEQQEAVSQPIKEHKENAVVVSQPETTANTETMPEIPNYIKETASYFESSLKRTVTIEGEGGLAGYNINIDGIGSLIDSRSYKEILVSIINIVPTSSKMHIVNLLKQYGKTYNINFRVITNEHDVLFNILSDDPDWIQPFDIYTRGSRHFIINM